MNGSSAQKAAAAREASAAMGNTTEGATHTYSSSLTSVSGMSSWYQGDSVKNRKSVAAVEASKPNNYTTTTLSYPEGLGDRDQGHWILFEILKNKPGKLAAAIGKEAEARDRVIANEKAARANYLMRGAVAANRDQTHAPDSVEKVRHRPSDAGLLNSSIQMKKPGSTTRLDTVIALYMPPSVQVRYDVKYGDQEIGIGAETGDAAVKAFQQEQGGLLAKATSAAGVGIDSIGAAVAQTAMDKAPGGLDTVIAIERGQVKTPRMELMFEGMGRRSFSYTFTFIPKSEQEAMTVENIVQTFKFHMMPDFANSFTSGVDGVREMTIPDHFNIRYMYRHQANTHLNKIATCALQSMDIDYGAERFTGYAEGRPQTTKIALNFTEFNIMSKAHVNAGF